MIIDNFFVVAEYGLRKLEEKVRLLLPLSRFKTLTRVSHHTKRSRNKFRDLVFIFKKIISSLKF